MFTLFLFQNITYTRFQILPIPFFDFRLYPIFQYVGSFSLDVTFPRFSDF